MLKRARHIAQIHAALRRAPVVALLGARQVGKTTLARQVLGDWPGPSHYFDLEDPDDLARLAEPKLALGGLSGLVVIDEIQRRPDLFPLLRVLADRPGMPARFLILGSAQPRLLKDSAESLAGRIAFHLVEGFSLTEVGCEHLQTLWRRGGFPRSFLAAEEAESVAWRRDFIRTFLERDLPQLGIDIPATTLHRFWRMLAHYHGQTWNGAELARAFGVAHTTVRRYLDILSGTLVVRQLPPWHENLSKRQVKAPKVYLADSGLLHSLLGLASQDDLEAHPKVGASWEGFVIREVLDRFAIEPEEAYFWATYAGAELDLLILRGGRRWGVEVIRTTAPKLTASMRSAFESLRLDGLFVIHAGEHAFPLAQGIDAVPFAHLDRLPIAPSA
ncbi:MAG: ATP-binding protein [Rhodocyclaceae bacterium]|nr:ATP-binding protein [Rhodocyclaceae bacterium]